MPSLIDEQTQFTDTDGLAIVNGSLYIGTQNSDPVANPITIYSDRDLTTPISNPQSLDSYGRSTNKIWIPGKYSLQVNNSASVQKYQALDAGDVTQTGISVLSNVQGTNTITAEGSPAIAALVDQQQYNFTTASANTGAVTLQIDLTAAKSILKQHDVALVSGDLEANQIVSVIYNGTDDAFELVSNALTSDFTSLTVGGDPVIPARAVVSGHIRAGNQQLVNGEYTSDTFSVDSLVTEAAWESVGPTGSGADNIWTGMDDIPATARAVIFDSWLRVSAVGAGQASIAFYATSGDITSPAESVDNNLRGRILQDMDVTGGQVSNYNQVTIPLDSNLVFKINWGASGEGATAVVDLTYRGFITD